MTGYTPEQLPVLNGIARDFGVFDHWFCEVPSQTFMNRSFWTAATSSGLVVNSPMRKWFTLNDAETIFERLEARGKTWKVYVMEPMVLSFTGLIHFPRLKDRLATHFVPFAEFERTPPRAHCRTSRSSSRTCSPGHGDYHPAMGRSFSEQVALEVDNPSSTLSGEAFLERVFSAYRAATSDNGTNVWNTTLLIGWDEPGGTYDHVPPGRSRRPTRPRLPASAASPSTDPDTASPPSSCRPGSNQGPCTTTNTATPHSSPRCGRSGDSATRSRSATRPPAPSITSLTRHTPRPEAHGLPQPRVPCREWTMDTEVVGKGLSTLGKGMGPALITMAQQMGVNVPTELDEPEGTLTPSLIVPLLRNVAGHFFPLLAQDASH